MALESDFLQSSVIFLTAAVVAVPAVVLLRESYRFLLCSVQHLAVVTCGRVCV